MIYGIGTDIVKVDRLERLYQRRGRRGAVRLLAMAELGQFDIARDKSRFLAKRFAAKEALAKALGTGMRGPVSFINIEITHDPLGKPIFAFHGDLAGHIQILGLVAHLSISDEADYAIAYVILEKL
ncbi:MAG: hypothetical protein RIR18_941 [Pseudomonadota bacterium]|jgi:holo-[acyl-carrier protein] synthase